MRMNQLPAVIGLNGPPHSGKTWLVAAIQRLIPDAVIMRPSDELFTIMQEQGLAPRGMLYQDFKLHPDARARLIAAATELRAKDQHVFDRRLTSAAAWQQSRVIILDNIGFSSEIDWYERHTEAFMLLRLDTKYNEIEPLKARGRRLNATWEGDSRVPVTYHTMLTAYDSLQMTMLLQWLAGPLTREEAGPYYGFKQLWNRYFAPRDEPNGDLFQVGGLAGVVGGLGGTAQSQPQHR